MILSKFWRFLKHLHGPLTLVLMSWFLLFSFCNSAPLCCFLCIPNFGGMCVRPLAPEDLPSDCFARTKSKGGMSRGETLGGFLLFCSHVPLPAGADGWGGTGSEAFEQVINKDTGEESRSAGLFVLIAFSSVGVPELPGDNGRPCLVLTSGPSSSGGAALSLSGCWTAFA